MKAKVYEYDSLSDAIMGLQKRGYTADFNLKDHCIQCARTEIELHPQDFTVDEFYRFEGMTNPDDSSILYAISGKNGLKGILVDAYGAYAESLTDEMAAKLRSRLDC